MERQSQALREARGPPELSFDFDQGLHYDPSAPEPVPEFEFDQRVSW